MFKFTTNRLCIKAISSDSQEHLYAFEVKNKDHFSSYGSFLFSKEKEDKPMWAHLFNHYLEEEKAGVSRRFCLFEKDKTDSALIGVCNFTQIFRKSFQAGYMGYRVDKDFEGKGLMFEAAKTLIDYMFQKENLHRIMANYMPSNTRSANLLKKLGFEIEGMAKAYLLINGVWEDHILTSCTNLQWKDF